MRIGRFRERILIEEATVVADADFGPTASKPTWAQKCRPWAEPMPVGGVEQIAALASVGKQTVRYRVRYRPDLTTKMRIATKLGIFDITLVEPEDFQNKFMVITGVKGMTGGG